jgi:chromosome segregation ATPase
MLATVITLSFLEMFFFLSGAVVLGITIHMFIGNLKSQRQETTISSVNGLTDKEWEMKYMQDLKMREEELNALEIQLRESEEKVKNFSTGVYELRWEQNRFESVKKNLEKRIKDLENKNDLHHIIMPEKRSKVAGE